MPAVSSTVAGGSSRGIGFFGKLRTGLALTRDSLRVIRAHPTLLAFPALGAVATLAFWTVFLVPLVVADLVGSGLEYVVLFCLYFATTFAATFFTAALVFAVNWTFHGEEPDLRESVRAAWRRKGPILVWSAAAATVSVVLKKLEESDSPAAAILSSLFALGWTVTTFFVVPVIVFEDVTARSMFRRSAETFRDTWGESIGVGLGVTLLQFLVGLVGVLLAVGIAVGLGALFPAAGLVVGVALVAGVLVTTYLLGQTAWGITKTALYVYAAEGRAPEEFAAFDFETLGGRTVDRATPGNAGPHTRFVE